MLKAFMKSFAVWILLFEIFYKIVNNNFDMLFNAYNEFMLLYDTFYVGINVCIAFIFE